MRLKKYEKKGNEKKDLKNKVGYLDISMIVNVYFKEIWHCYDMGRDRENFLDVKDFLKSFYSLSKEDFFEDVKEFYERKEMFSAIYLLVNGYDRGAEVLLKNNKSEVKPEHMKQYVSEMQKRATSRLKNIIDKLDKILQKEEKSKENIDKPSKELLNYKNVKTNIVDEGNKENLVKDSNKKSQNSKNLKNKFVN